LCRAGFRRSHDVVYRPACLHCNACVPIRIPVDAFKQSRSIRRLITRNKDLIWHRVETKPTPELYALFAQYQRSRHGDSDMARMTESDFAAMLLEGKVDTHLYIVRDAQNNLRGGMIADPVGDGLSAVYSFYDPGQPQRSLGSFLIQSLVAQAKQLALPYVYLGYWIAKAPKMAYKTRFEPLECLDETGWHRLEPNAAARTDREKDTP
jgi:arginine-tRNA-protein transferase